MDTRRYLQSLKRLIFCAALSALVTACGSNSNNGDSQPPAPVTHTIGVTVSGLAAGTSLVLQNNAGNDLTVSANAAAVFTTAITSGGTYNVTVKTQPINPNQICTVTNGSGTVTTANINVVVACVTTPLTVTSITPANNATNVSRSIVPALSFSTALNASTLTPSNITLKSSVSNVSAVSAITAGSTTSAFNVVSKQLLPLTQYTLTVTGSVRGQYGESLANAVTSQFTTRDGMWGTAVPIETDNGRYVSNPQIGVDADGNALTVWGMDDGTRYNIWSNRYTAGSGWGTAVLIETDAGHATDPQIAVDANGNAVAVWYQHIDSVGTNYSIVSNRYTVGGGWGTATVIETDDAGGAFYPQVAMDASGNALAVWVQSNGPHTNIMSNRYTAGSGWGTATPIETNLTDSDRPQIVMDANGNALAAWIKNDGTVNNIWSNRYTVGSGWGTATLIETDDAGNADQHHIAMDANGSALAVWRQSDGTVNNIWSNRYTIGSGWGTAMLIEADAGDTTDPQIAMDVSGNALAVWSMNDGTRYNIVSNRYTAGIGWGTAALIEIDNAGDAQSPQIKIDVNGNALAVWQQYDGTVNNIWSNRYIAGSGWGTATLIETDNAGFAAFPVLAVDASGSAFSVWVQYDGTRQNVLSNRFE